MNTKEIRDTLARGPTLTHKVGFVLAPVVITTYTVLISNLMLW